MKKLRWLLILLFGFFFIGIVLYFSKSRPHLVPLLWNIPYSIEDCGGTGFKHDALERLNVIRCKVKKRYFIFSGYRDEKMNKTAGGVSNSQHIKGNAIDLWVPMNEREAFYKAAKEAGFKGFGWGSRSVHIDMGKRRWWTYDNNANAMYGSKRNKYLYKAPKNFKEDFNIN